MTFCACDAIPEAGNSLLKPVVAMSPRVSSGAMLAGNAMPPARKIGGTSSDADARVASASALASGLTPPPTVDVAVTAGPASREYRLEGSSRT